MCNSTGLAIHVIMHLNTTDTRFLQLAQYTGGRGYRLKEEWVGSYKSIAMIQTLVEAAQNITDANRRRGEVVSIATSYSNNTPSKKWEELQAEIGVGWIL